MAGKPENPTDLTLTVTAVSLTAAWKRGFDGGLQQTFHLKYDGNEKLIVDDKPHDDDHYTVRLGVNEGITESTTYTVSLYAQNELGSSKTLEETEATKGSKSSFFIFQITDSQKQVAQFQNVHVCKELN